MKHIVDLEWDGNGQVKATEKPSGDITNYPLKKGDKPHGSVVIWEYPVKDPPLGLYIGGCLTPGEKVITQRGLVNVEDVTLDDRLLNKDGKFVEIKNLQRYEKENEDIHTIKVQNSFRTTTFTGEHPIFVSDSIDGKFDFVKARDINVGQYTRIPNVYKGTNSIINSPIDSTNFWWFIGLWLGDGWVDLKKHSVSIAFDLKQNTFYDRYHSFLKENNIYYYERIRNGSLEVNFTSKEISEWLNKTFGKYCYYKHIPDNIKRIKDEYKIALLQGYLDSDGSVCYNKIAKNSQIEFVSVNLELLEDIQDMCFALDVVGGISKLRDAKKSTICGRIINQREAYHLRLSGSQTIKLSKLMLQNTCYQDEKLCRIDFSRNIKSANTGCVCKGKYIYIKIKEIITSRYTGTVYNFECETHTFMCRNILTHNCDPLTYQRGIIEQKR